MTDIVSNSAKRPKRTLQTAIAACLSAMLAFMLIPASAFASQPASEPDDGLVAQTTQGWTAQGDIEWRFDNGTLKIRPVNNGSVGHLNDTRFFQNLENIRAVEINGGRVIAPRDCDGLFFSGKVFGKVTRMDLSSFDTSSTTNMCVMFRGCDSLKSLDLSKFNTSNVVDMNCMFADCGELESLDVSSFDTSRVVNMDRMFDGCYMLKSLNVSNFNTNRTLQMGRMFRDCASLTSLDVSNFNTANVTDMALMFAGMRELTSIDLSNFRTADVTTMFGMFQQCTSLKSLDLTSFDTSKVKGVMGEAEWMYGMCDMFNGCSSLQTLDLSSFDTSNVATMRDMFARCNALNKLSVGSKFKFYENSDKDTPNLPDDKWKSAKTGSTFTSSQIVKNRSNIADTYTRGNASSGSGTDSSIVTMLRLYNPNTGEHLFTSDTNERDTLVPLGWKYEGEAWKAPASGDAVYRLYNPNTGEHHYTTDSNEYATLQPMGWRGEGVFFHSDAAKGTPVYRLFNSHADAFTHHYTTDSNEYSVLKRGGWTDEAVGWYGLK